MPDYPKEQLSELYKNLPKDLQEATFSKEVGRNIQEICTKNGVADRDTISEVAKNVAYVFLGLLPPNEFSYVLEKELKLEKDKAEEIAAGITRFVFLPVRASLEALYKMEIRPSIKPGAAPPSPGVPPPPPGVPLPPRGKPKRKDIYREPIE